MATSHQFLPFRPSLGLLTTVADLPPSYKVRYVTPESPLDLSVKTVSSAPMTPPSTPSPIKKRYREETDTEMQKNRSSPIRSKLIKVDVPAVDTQKQQITPQKPIRTISPPKTSKSHPPPKEPKKHKAVRKLKFDETKSSPVSGTIIRPLEEIDENVHESGDIDPQYNIVEITDEAKAEIAAIPNVIGAYMCKLCRNEFDDAFGLAQHRCSCIVLLEYRCPECGKRFNCPANLASHRRWHKPKDEVLKKQQENSENEQQFPCSECGKFFKRQAYLRKHLATHRGKKSNAPAAGKIQRNSESSGSFKTGDESTCSSDATVGPLIINEVSDHSGRESESNSPFSYSMSSSAGFATQVVFKSEFTDDENLAVAALAHLRNGPSVIKHTTTLVT